MKHDGNVHIILGQLSKDQLDGVVFTTDLITRYFLYKNDAWDVIGYTKDVIRPFSPVFFFHKHSVLRWIFNRKIEMCQQSGLIVHWIAVYKHEFDKIKRRQPKKLSINGILTILQITAVMYLVASIVFAMEILSQRAEKIKKFLDFLTY